MRGEERTIKGKLERALQRREDLHTLALPREDVVGLFHQWIDTSAAVWPKRSQIRHTGMIEGPMKNWQVNNFNPLCPLGNHTLEPSAVCFLLGPVLKEGIAKTVESWQWPEEVGPSLADRRKELVKLDKEIEKLQSQLDDIRGIARAEGLSIRQVESGTAADKPMVKAAKAISQKLRGE